MLRRSRKALHIYIVSALHRPLFKNLPRRIVNKCDFEIRSRWYLNFRFTVSHVNAVNSCGPERPVVNIFTCFRLKVPPSVKTIVVNDCPIFIIKSHIPAGENIRIEETRI